AAQTRAAYLRNHTAWGYGIRLVDRAEAARIEPSLVEPPDLALHVPAEGAVEPRLATQALLADAARRGARLLPRTPVSCLLHGNGAVTGVETQTDTLLADTVVLATGVATATLA